MTKTLKCDVLVIGTGIIGSMAALYLQNAGREVVLLERGEVARGASSGNAGILAFPEIIPIPAPGIIKKAPRWLFDPLGPLSVPPAYAAKIAPWLWRFWRASAERNFRHGLKSLTEINRLAAMEMAHITAIPELSHLVSKTGTLDLYDSEASLNAARKDWDEKENAGFTFERVGRNEIEELQPGIAPQFRHAIFSPDGLQVSDPYDFTRAIFDLVIACGAWSKKLAATLGNIVPLETERGYNTTLPASAFNLTRQLYFNDHGFVVTPLATGIRVGGAVELGGLELKPNFRRAEAMLKKAGRFLPGLKLEDGKQWMGFRPSMPDCLPVIGTARTTPSVIYAFGHGHLGLTQSAATARLVTQLANGEETAISVDPFRPGRFS